MSDVETLEALRDRIREDLQRGAEQDAEHEMRHELLQELASRDEGRRPTCWSSRKSIAGSRSSSAG